jgi:hypothetical protein
VGLQVPDWLRYEVGHRIEWLQERWARLGVRETINDNPSVVAVTACGSLAVLIVVLVMVLRPGPQRRQEEGRLAWFYDLNTGQLFTADSKKAGPIEAPSGPLPDGGPAGFRANVYSYVLDPNESDLFVGFLERPDPNAKGATPDRSDFEAWTQGVLIRRVEDQDWVSAAGAAGEKILMEMTRPNEKGQTPIYQVPR